VSPTLFDEVAGDQFYSFVMKCWERRPRCSRSTCRVCGKLSRRPVVMVRVGRRASAAAEARDAVAGDARL